MWDNTKTLRQNYEKLGLVANINKMEEAPKTEEPLIRKNERMALDLEFIEAEEIKREDNIMSVYDQNYIKKLIDKHGDDVDAMFRDIKLNTNQLTVGQLKKKIEKYYRVQELYAAPKDEE